SHDFTIAVYLLIAAVGVGLEIRSSSERSRIPSLATVFSRVMRTRSGRVGVMAGWGWVGVAIFARWVGLPRAWPGRDWRQGPARPEVRHEDPLAMARRPVPDRLLAHGHARPRVNRTPSDSSDVRRHVAGGAERQRRPVELPGGCVGRLCHRCLGGR